MNASRQSMSQDVDRISIEAEDGHRFSALLPTSLLTSAETPLLAFLPALGVSARPYGGFVEALNKRGINAVVMDWRGIGSSSWRASRRQDWGAQEILHQDIPAFVQALRDRFPNSTLFLGGHSLGGQFAALAANMQQAAGVVIHATGNPYAATYSGLGRLGMHGIGFFVPLLTRIWGYFPGKLLRFGGNEGARLMQDWAHTVRTGEYAPKGCDCDHTQELADYTGPVLGLPMPVDGLIAEDSLRRLLAQMSAAHSQWQTIPKEAFAKPGHFSILQEPQPIAAAIADFIQEL